MLRTKDTSKPNTWPECATKYSVLIRDPQSDSCLLRHLGLENTIPPLVGDCVNARVLDAGCANGWLLDTLQPREGHGCDICKYDDFPAKWKFQQDDIRSLSYETQYFDVSIASLVLMWFPEFEKAISELHRVTKTGGSVIIAIMNPYFYRMGEVNKEGNFVIEKDLSKPFVIDNHRIAEAVGPFVYHYRPLPDYLNACISAGLSIEELVDWHIDMEQFVAKFGSDKPGNIRRTGKVPMYSFIKCVRS